MKALLIKVILRPKANLVAVEALMAAAAAEQQKYLFAEGKTQPKQ